MIKSSAGWSDDNFEKLVSLVKLLSGYFTGLKSKSGSLCCLEPFLNFSTTHFLYKSGSICSISLPNVVPLPQLWHL